MITKLNYFDFFQMAEKTKEILNSVEEKLIRFSRYQSTEKETHESFLQTVEISSDEEIDVSIV